MPLAWIDRAWRLPARDWRVLLESALAAVAIEAALRVWSLDRILRVIEDRWFVGAPARFERDSLQRIVRLAEWPYALLPMPATCLRVSLVRLVILRRRGVPAALRIGVRRATDAALDAHAWIECDGPLGDEPALGLYQEIDLQRAGLPGLRAPAGVLSRSGRWS